MKKESGYKWKLGLFVAIGIILVVSAVYYVGKQKNLFGSTFRVKVMFKTVSGLKVGNNVRFSGINIGTVDNIQLVSDTAVKVEMVIRKSVQPFIKSDATANIGSDGLMGDKVLVISPGTSSNEPIKDNAFLVSHPAVEMEQIMTSLKTTADNAGVITNQLALFTSKMNNGKGALNQLIGDEGFSNNLKNTLVHLDKSTGEFAKFTEKMNNGKGALSKLVSDEKFANTLDSTMANLKSSSKGLSDNMEAAQHNFLLKGYFKKKKRAEAKKQKAIQDSLKTKQLP